MGARVRWRPALAAVLGAVALGAGAVGGTQALGDAPAPGAPSSVRTVGPGLPGASDPDAIVPPAGAVARPPGFAPSAVVPVPLPAPAQRSRPPRGPSSPGSSPDAPTTTPSHRPGREPTSGESQYEYGCRRGYITEGC